MNIPYTFCTNSLSHQPHFKSLPFEARATLSYSTSNTFVGKLAD